MLCGADNISHNVLEYFPHSDWITTLAPNIEYANRSECHSPNLNSLFVLHSGCPLPCCCRLLIHETSRSSHMYPYPTLTQHPPDWDVHRDVHPQSVWLVTGMHHPWTGTLSHTKYTTMWDVSAHDRWMACVHPKPVALLVCPPMRVDGEHPKAPKTRRNRLNVTQNPLKATQRHLNPHQRQPDPYPSAEMSTLTQSGRWPVCTTDGRVGTR